MNGQRIISDKKMVIGSLVLLALVGGFILSVYGFPVGSVYGILVGLIVFLLARRYRNDHGL